MIIGVDEVGLGAWAGPLVVCAFAAPDESWTIPGLADSKKFQTEAQVLARSHISSKLLREFPNNYAMVEVEAQYIDLHGLTEVLSKALNRAVESLIKRLGLPDRVVIDGEDKGVPGAEFIPKADGTFPCVSAASILAKVHRDNYMTGMAGEYPQYGFVSHAGYGTPQHRKAIDAYGLCPLHRKSFQPMRGILDDKAAAEAGEEKK